MMLCSPLWPARGSSEAVAWWGEDEIGRGVEGGGLARGKRLHGGRNGRLEVVDREGGGRQEAVCGLERRLFCVHRWQSREWKGGSLREAVCNASKCQLQQDATGRSRVMHGGPLRLRCPLLFCVCVCGVLRLYSHFGPFFTTKVWFDLMFDRPRRKLKGAVGALHRVAPEKAGGGPYRHAPGPAALLAPLCVRHTPVWPAPTCPVRPVPHTHPILLVPV